MTDITVGFIGLGNMGGGMSMNIARGGYSMVVHDLNRDNAIDLLEYGAEWAESPKELAEKSDIVFTSLPGPTEVEAMATGNEGLLQGAKPKSYCRNAKVDYGPQQCGGIKRDCRL